MPRLEEIAPMIYDSLGAYAVFSYQDYIIDDHHAKIINFLERIERGEVMRGIIVMPPRHGKSMLASEFFPPWCLGRHPDWPIIHASYGQDLSTHFGRQVKRQITSAEFQHIFRDCRLIEDTASATHARTTRRGGYTATSVGGAITGLGSMVMVLDDLLKNRQDAESEVVRNGIWEWYTSTARTRLQPGGRILVILTRWHEDDIVGRLLKQSGEKWEILHLPAIKDDGQALWPRAYPIETLQEIKRELGSYDFEALYQGRPSPRGGGIMQIGKVGRYEPDQAPPMQRLILAVDTAAKTKDHNDYSVIALMGKAQDGVYVLGIWRQRVEYPALRAAIRSQFDAYRPEMVCIEDSSAGTAVIQELRVDGGLPIKAVRAAADKVTRATPLSAGIECGRLKLPTLAPWLQDLETELGQFPAGKHDDQVDALALGYSELHMAGQVANIANPLFARGKGLALRR